MSRLTRWGFDRKARAFVRPVPLVRRILQVAAAAEDLTAASARGESLGCEVRDPEGSSGVAVAVAQERATPGRSINAPAKSRSARALIPEITGANPPAPVTAPQRAEPVPPIPRPAAVRTLDLATAPSAMDTRWAQNAETVAAQALRERGEGMVACKCHPEGFVPSWFGGDCIEAVCPLREVAA